MVSNQSNVYHEPVMPGEVVDLLVTDDNGAYLDLTAGGGGHLQSLARRLKDRARLYGIDRDQNAVDRARNALGRIVQKHVIIKAAFGDLESVVDQFGDKSFSGIFLDLGLSSSQLDDAGRGFSFTTDGPLDMRFDTSGGKTAAELIATLGQKELTRLIRDYGEERQAARIAASIVRERQRQMIRTTGQLSEIIEKTIRSRYKTKSLARVFQAFRIAVNGELEQLAAVLPVSLSLLGSKGRLAVISYHSLEDRLVKRFLQAETKGRCTCPQDLPVCLCGSRPTMLTVTRRPVAAGADEVARNPRARSARLRVGEKL